MKVVVIGGGAAGFFTAISIAEKHPETQVEIWEKTDKYLSKVKVSGGGRCNVTNQRSLPSELTQFYPRGQKKLHSVFKKFSTSDMVAWLDAHGVPTHAEEDQRMFPVSNNSQTIVDCFVNTAWKLKIKLHPKRALTKLEKTETGWLLHDGIETTLADKVVICTGPSPAIWNLLLDQGLALSQPVASLFTFHISDERIHELYGVPFNQVKVKVVGSKLEDSGPMIITHWGLSGPAILKLSSWGARELAALNYRFEILINFLDMPNEAIRAALLEMKTQNPKRRISNYPVGALPKRFWERITIYSGIGEETLFEDLSKAQLNKLVEELAQGRYRVEGKSAFKEEFVTCGGVKLDEIDLETFEVKKLPGLYLAGEILDIDGLTGGFNFQACWSAGWCIAEAI